ncbi:MAG: ABC transporter ATP-binding protein [Eubacteriales bacterium]|nr:ABC transporter ATP-binding protein [Eubacteriales bacterium]
MKMKNKKNIQNNVFDKGIIIRLFSYLKPYHIKIITIIVAIIISSLVSVYTSLYIQVVIDDYIYPLLASNNPDFTLFIHSIIRYAIILLIGVITSLIFHMMMVNVSQSVLKDLRDEMFSKMQYFPISYFDTNSHGDLMSHFTNDIDALRELIGRTVSAIFTSILTIIFVFFSMLLTSINLTIIILVCITMIIIYSGYLAKKSGEHFFKSQDAIAALDGFVEEMINGAKEIKVFCYEEKNKNNFNDRNILWKEQVTKANTYASIIFPSMAGFGNLLYVLIAIIGAFFAINSFPNFSLKGINILSLGMIASFLSLTKSFVRPISEVSAQMNTIIQGLSGANRIFKFLDQKFEIDDGTIDIKKEDVKGAIVFNNVNFSYDNNKQILKNISLYAKPGQKIALVGHTGAGKTTITNLINRFYDINSGEILYDGINIKNITKYSLRNSLAIVLQDVNLFTGSVMDNIRYGNLNASDEECIKAAKMANASSFIEMLPDGYNTLITGGGSSLSQGQRQLISIARALVADPEVLILDEATSSIDTRTEQLISNGMDTLMNGRTVLVIAHRLSTIKNAKAILVMENGEIIERGDHETLMNLKGKYYELYSGSKTI